MHYCNDIMLYRNDKQSIQLLEYGITQDGSYYLLWNCRFPFVFLFTTAILGNHSLLIMSHIERTCAVIMCKYISESCLCTLPFLHYIIMLNIVTIFCTLIEDSETGKGKPWLTVQLTWIGTWRAHIQTYTQTRVYTHMYTHAHVHIHTRTHIQTRTDTYQQPKDYRKYVSELKTTKDFISR